MRVHDSSATRIFFLKNRMMQHRAQNITIKFLACEMDYQLETTKIF